MHGDVNAHRGCSTKSRTSGLSPEADLRDASRLSYIYGELARLYRRIGRPDRAQPLENSRLELWRHWDRTGQPQFCWLRKTSPAQ